MNHIEAMKLALENSQPSFMSPGWTLVRNEDITALREALAQPEQQPVASIYITPDGAREFDDWKCELPVGSNILYTTPQLPAQQQELTLQEQLEDALQSRDFYRRRVEALQQWQSKMRDPERTIVCDIIANGCTLEPAGDRYKLTEQPAQGCNYCNHALYSGTKCKNCGRVTEQAAIKRDLTPEQPAQQEPVYFCDYGYEGWGKVDAAMAAENIACGMTVEAYYTRPQAREPLTDEQIDAAIKAWFGNETVAGRQPFAKRMRAAIEAAHGIKE